MGICSVGLLFGVQCEPLYTAQDVFSWVSSIRSVAFASNTTWKEIQTARPTKQLDKLLRLFHESGNVKNNQLP